MRTVIRLAGPLLLSVGLVSCGPAAPVSVTTPASVVPTTTGLTLTQPAPSPTTPAEPTTTDSTGPPVTPAKPTCEAARQWSQTQGDLTLTVCFEPHPPQLGILTAYDAVLVGLDGQPVSDATVELTLIGDMIGMESEYDEAFSVMLESQGAGRYMAQARGGRTDLVVTEVQVEIQHGRQSWTFSVPAGDLPPP